MHNKAPFGTTLLVVTFVTLAVGACRHDAQDARPSPSTISEWGRMNAVELDEWNAIENSGTVSMIVRSSMDGEKKLESWSVPESQAIEVYGPNTHWEQVSGRVRFERNEEYLFVRIALRPTWVHGHIIEFRISRRNVLSIDCRLEEVSDLLYDYDTPQSLDCVGTPLGIVGIFKNDCDESFSIDATVFKCLKNERGYDVVTKYSIVLCDLIWL